MDRDRRTRRPLVLLLAFVGAILLFGMNCTLGAMVDGTVSTERVKTKNADATNWAATYTQYAKDFNDHTATVEQATEHARKTEYAKEEATWESTLASMTAEVKTREAPQPPIITGINFPSQIPGNGSTIIGLLYFEDPNGDIRYVQYNVIRAKEFKGGRDDKPNLDSGTWEKGALKIYVFCNGEQSVTLEAIVIDWMGNQSNPWRFTFTCTG